MSEEELVEQYTQGRISRRMFVRRLIAGGLSLAAAVAYGDALGAVAAAASPSESPDFRRRHHHHHHHHHRKHHQPPP